jgi:hypothetical protein
MLFMGANTLLGQVGGQMNAWLSSNGLTPFHRAQKSLDIQGPTLSHLPLNELARIKSILCPFAVYYLRYAGRSFFTIMSRSFLNSGTLIVKAWGCINHRSITSYHCSVLLLIYYMLLNKIINSQLEVNLAPNRTLRPSGYPPLI